ncbi:hypothetical protein FRC02_004298 [Tulasnella sp. 418]|nr:hypothetical protein FRC02_004298 [Tulasnella sp. 418]
MVHLSEIPLFRGDELEDAEKWQQDFLLATAQYSDQAVARLFISKLARGSPASDYVNSLPSKVRGSWLELDQIFQNKWLSMPTADTHAGERWSVFEDHILTEAMIFQSISSPDEDSSPGQRILCWVEDHIRLGQATRGPDEPLIRLTKAHLPFFILAALSLKAELTSFVDFCDAIAQIPREVLEMERVRHQSAGHRDERLLAIERKLEEMSQKMDRYFQGDRNTSVVHENTVIEDANLGHGSTKDNPSAPASDITAQQNNLPTSLNPLTSSNPNATQDAQHVIASYIPSYWRKTVMFLNKIEQIGVAQRAVNNLILQVKNEHEFKELGDPQAAGAWAVLAIHSELVPFSKKRKNKVEQAMLVNCPSQLSQDERTNNARLKWALTFCYGFKAFSKPQLLQGAIDYWSEISENCLVRCNHFGLIRGYEDRSLEDNSHPGRNGSRGFCGGVFVGRHRNGGIGSHQTTVFMALSAFLAACTGEKKYHDAAILSARCIQAHMLDLKTFLIKDCIFDIQIFDVQGFKEREEDTRVSCFLTGAFLEGLSALALVTWDAQWCDLARNTASAVMDLSDWHTQDGILAPRQTYTPRLFNVQASKGILIRGLHGAYICNASDLLFQAKVRAYINVQYNALRDLARKGDSYSLNWAGPFDEPLVIAQVTAMDVLLAAIAVNDLGFVN